MTIELDERSMNVLAAKVAKLVAKAMKREDQDVRYVTCREAARMLGISSDRLRKTKDKYCYVKRGESERSRLYFRADSLHR